MNQTSVNLIHSFSESPSSAYIHQSISSINQFIMLERMRADSKGHSCPLKSRKFRFPRASPRRRFKCNGFEASPRARNIASGCPLTPINWRGRSDTQPGGNPDTISGARNEGGKARWLTPFPLRSFLVRLLSQRQLGAKG